MLVALFLSCVLTQQGPLRGKGVTPLALPTWDNNGETPRREAQEAQAKASSRPGSCHLVMQPLQENLSIL